MVAVQMATGLGRMDQLGITQVGMPTDQRQMVLKIA